MLLEIAVILQRFNLVAFREQNKMKVVKKMKANQNKLKVNQNEMNEKKREKEILLILLAYVRKFLYLCTLFKKQLKNRYMKNLLENLGAILVLLGVICLAVYYFGVQVNALLIASMVLEVAGVLSYVFLSKLLK